MSTREIPSTGELALDDRAALRRVAGLSTELADITEVEYRQLRLERVVLVGVWTEGSAADAGVIHVRTGPNPLPCNRAAVSHR